MANTFVEPPANTGSGNKVDAEEVLIAAENRKRQRVKIPGPDTAATSRPEITSSSGQILAANAKRKRFVIHNEGTAGEAIYVNEGAAAVLPSGATGAYAAKILPGDPYVSPFPCFTGAVHAILDAAGPVRAMVVEETSSEET